MILSSFFLTRCSKSMFKKKKKRQRITLYSPPRPGGFSVTYQETVPMSFSQEMTQWNRDLVWLGYLALNFILLYMLHPSWDVVSEHVLVGCSCQMLFQINRAQAISYQRYCPENQILLLSGLAWLFLICSTKELTERKCGPSHILTSCKFMNTLYSAFV